MMSDEYARILENENENYYSINPVVMEKSSQNISLNDEWKCFEIIEREAISKLDTLKGRF
jgi:hypothetical protein